MRRLVIDEFALSAMLQGESVIVGDTEFRLADIGFDRISYLLADAIKQSPGFNHRTDQAITMVINRMGDMPMEFKCVLTGDQVERMRKQVGSIFQMSDFDVRHLACDTLEAKARFRPGNGMAFIAPVEPVGS